MLNYAARYGRSKCVKTLVQDFNADVNVFDDGGFTPLANAVYVGDIKTVNVLLDAGFEPCVIFRENEDVQFLILHQFCRCRHFYQRQETLQWVLVFIQGAITFFGEKVEDMC